VTVAEEPSCPSGETVEDLREDFEEMIAALKRRFPRGVIHPQ
jgi:hypothetical protein